MTRALLLLFTAGLLFISCGDDDSDSGLTIDNTQRSVVFYRGATWCPPCGEYGTPWKEQIANDYGPSKVVFLAFQTEDKISPESSDGANLSIVIREITNNNGIPYYFLSGNDHFFDFGISTNSDFNASTFMGENSKIDDVARIGVNATASFSNDMVQVNAGVEFFEAINEDCFLSAFLLEDGIVAEQSAISTPKVTQTHNNVVRANADGTSIKGENIGFSFNVGDKENRNFTISIPTIGNGADEINTNNLKVAVVVWKGNDFRMENAVMIDL